MKFRKILRWFLPITGVAIMVGGYVYSQSKIPQRFGNHAFTNLHADVTVAYDEWGIPHIDAGSELDAMKALGFVHGQDRLWQMDLLRRLGSGRLSELFGDAALDVDKLARVFGMTEYAKQQLQHTIKNRPDITAKIEAYYAGVNHAIATRPTPVEYDLLGISPEPFVHQDLYAVMSYIAYSFAGGARTDILMESLRQALSPDLFHQLRANTPTIPSGSLAADYYQNHDSQNIALDVPHIDQLLSSLTQFGSFDGSNAWVISGEKTESGKPYFANDPHMQMSTPAVWYESQVVTPTQSYYGHFLAGIPMPLLNRTPHHVFGLTMLSNDSVDFYVLGENTTSRPEDFQTRQEVIKVAGSDDVILDVVTTPAGPIVNGLFGLPEEPLVAMGWTFTQPENHLASTLHDIAFASGHEQIKTAVDKHWSPGINILYADVDGNIAHWAAARYRDHSDNNSTAFIPVEGDIHDAQKFHSRDYNPVRFNPETGLSFSVNHPLLLNDGKVADGYYPPASRLHRATELFFNKEVFTVEDMKQFQNDSMSYRAVDLRDQSLPFLEAQHFDDIASVLAVREVLGQWDGNYNETSIAATIIERFSFYLKQHTFADEMGEHFDTFNKNGSVADKSMHNVLFDEDSDWWKNAQVVSPNPRKDVMTLAWADTISSLVSEHGSDVTAWEWGTAATILHPHALGRSAPLGLLFSVGPAPLNSGTRTLNNMLYRNNGGAIVNSYGPSTRRIVDLADIENGLNVNPVGQSGVVFDSHYDDQFELYMKGDYREAKMWSAEEIRGANNYLLLTH